MSSTQVRELIRDDADFRRETERLYVGIFRQSLNKSCSNCWFDAFILLMRTDLNKLNAMKEKRFDLRAGAVLYDVVNHDPTKTVTHHNITDELALYHLRTNPDYIKFFNLYPDNWQELALASSNNAAAPTKPAEVEDSKESDAAPANAEQQHKPAGKPAHGNNRRNHRR